MQTPSPEGVMYEVTRRIEELNQLASRLNGLQHGVFEPASLNKPKLNPAELGFIQVVSYLYVLYYEVGNVGDFDSETNIIDVYVGYLRRKIDAEGERPLLHTIRGAGYVLKVEE